MRYQGFYTWRAFWSEFWRPALTTSAIIISLWLVAFLICNHLNISIG